MTTERLPASVDLRSDYEETYRQGPSMYCGGFGTANVIDAMLDRVTDPKSPAFGWGRERHVSPHYIYWNARSFYDQPHVDGGSGFDELAKALNRDGFLLEDEYRPELPREQQDFARARSRLPLRVVSVFETQGVDLVHQLKRSLAQGYPMIVATPIYEGAWEGQSGKNWREHDFAIEGAQVLGHHWWAWQGYDDACGRFLAEGSDGNDVGDGGFKGFTYDQVRSRLLVEAAWRIEFVPGVRYAPVSGFVPETVAEPLPAREMANQYERLQPWLAARIREAFAKEGLAGLLQLSARMGLSARTIETCAGLAPGFVQAFAAANPGQDWWSIHFDAPDWIVIPHRLTTREAATQMGRLLPFLRGCFAQVLADKGVKGVQDFASELKASDLLLEACYQFERGRMRSTFDAAANLDARALVWEPL